eukprot:7263087-Alexandrium_andersonii.AAC.1
MLLLPLWGIPLLMLAPGLRLSGWHLLLLLWRDRAYWILTTGRTVRCRRRCRWVVLLARGGR